MKVELTTEERDQIIYWINGRLPSAKGVLTEDYRREFLANRTPEQLEEIYSERRAEIEMLNNLKEKLQ